MLSGECNMVVPISSRDQSHAVKMLSAAYLDIDNCFEIPTMFPAWMPSSLKFCSSMPPLSRLDIPAVVCWLRLVIPLMDSLRARSNSESVCAKCCISLAYVSLLQNNFTTSSLMRNRQKYHVHVIICHEFIWLIWSHIISTLFQILTFMVYRCHPKVWHSYYLHGYRVQEIWVSVDTLRNSMYMHMSSLLLW